LPRSGSTMLQKILGAHEKVYTRSEPWVMLHPLSLFRTYSVSADYDQRIAANAIDDFLEDISRAKDTRRKYFSTIRASFLKLYDQHLKKAKKEYFLDKTPRYYLVFDELRETYPNAKFIILKRNPLAVFCSILDTWLGRDFDELTKFKVDLDLGVEFMSRDFSNYENCLTIKYEDLLENPENLTEELFDFLNVSVDLSCINYDNKSNWKYGDQGSVYDKDTPDLQHADKWKDTICKEDYSFLSMDYIQRIGREQFEATGYNFEEVVQIIESSGDLKKNADREVKPLNYLLMTNFEKELYDTEKKAADDRVLLRQSQDAQKAIEKVQVELTAFVYELKKDIKRFKGYVNERNLKVNDLQAKLEETTSRNSKLVKREHQLSSNLSQVESNLVREKDETEKNRLLIRDVKRFNILRNPIKKFYAYKKLIDLD